MTRLIILFFCLISALSVAAQPGHNATTPEVSPTPSATISLVVQAPATLSPSATISSVNGTQDTNDGFLGLEEWEWILIGIAILLVFILCCGAGVVVWIKYKAWKFNSDWNDDHY